MKNFSPLQNFKKENFYKYPFPHLIIDNAVQDNVYEELSNNFPEPHENLDDYDNMMCTAPSNHIFKNENIKNIWNFFV